jgi:hypothetical protein
MAALHAVCTKKDHQRQGLASALIIEVVQWAKKISDFQILFTEIPSFYEKLGFVIIKEHRFHLKHAYKKGSKLFSALAAPKDDNLFLRCFREREPLSQRFWIEDRGEIASFNVFFGKCTYPSYWSIYYCPEFDGFLSWFFEGETLHLLDIVAAKIPSLEQIIEYLPQNINEIYFYFPTDRLGIETMAESYLYDNGHLMVHGALPCKEPFMIAPLSRC